MRGRTFSADFHDNKEEFTESVKERDPLNLSAIHTGKILYGKEFILPLQKYKPNKYTIKKCMLNSFAALGMGISDLLHGMLYDDAVNSLYHAARSSLWATLMEKEITPPNRRILELLEDGEMKKGYQEIIAFRNNIPKAEHDFELERKVWEIGNINEFTSLLQKVNEIVKKNHQKVFGKNFIGCFDTLGIPHVYDVGNPGVLKNHSSHGMVSGASSPSCHPSVTGGS